MQDEPRRISLDALDLRYASLRLVQPALLGALRASIERDGLLHPLVAQDGGEGQLPLLDGFKRREVLKKLGWEEAPVQVVKLSDSQAKAALILYNRRKNGLCEVEEGWIVRSLCREHKLGQADVARLLGRHRSWVCRRLQLAERLVDSLREDVRLGLLSPTSARELARLPRGNQVAAAEAVAKNGLSSRDAARLVEILLVADEETARAVLGDPLRFLEVERRESPEDPRLSEEGRIVKAAAGRFEGAAVWLELKLRQATPKVFGDTEAEVLLPAVEPACRAGLAAIEELKSLHKGLERQRDGGS